jgi:D-alanyl-lipoteichoic acid acyltransferase DltB (MBOAT superfamily)
MIFNSLTFLVFALLFVPVYFALRGRSRMYWMLGASYLFYGWWDWRFLALIGCSTLADFALGKWLDAAASENRRRQLLWVSVVLNLGILGFFKYFNFFADSLQVLLSSLGLNPSLHTLQVILPVGISFYTFQSMSYTLDIYRRELEPERDVVRYATFVAFWPQLVAGPIVRAADFLPQLGKDATWQWGAFASGMNRIMWGFFKKVVVADSLAPFVDQCWEHPDGFTAVNLWIAVFFYSFQIYCDFSGYSDIAIGFARMLGFHFPENFRTPYFSRDFSEFWTRWHRSLSGWLRDYLYIPLGGNRHHTFRNLMATMLLGGLWHGANWTFVFWGFLHGCYLIAQRLGQRVLQPVRGRFPLPVQLVRALQIAVVFSLTSLAWIWFRSPDFVTAAGMLRGMFEPGGFQVASIMNKFLVLKGMLLISALLAVEASDLRIGWGSQLQRRPWLQLTALAAIVWSILLLGTFGSNAFIYFQF